MTAPDAAAMPLTSPDARGVLFAASRDPDAKVMFVDTGASGPDGHTSLAVKVPVTAKAGDAVEGEGRMLVELRRMPLGPLADTVPRYVRSLRVDGRPALVSTAMPGAPMSRRYHEWHHTARRRNVREDLRMAGGWLRELQNRTANGAEVVTWPSDVADSVRGRWDGHPCLAPALRRLQTAEQSLRGQRAPRTVVHGDFWFGNVLVLGDRVSGVVDWECGTMAGSPLRDLARFAISYGLYLDRHVRPGRTVPGHRGLRRVGFGPGVAYALLGNGWVAREVRGFLGDGLLAVGLSRGLWYDVALTGIGEVAAVANDEAFGAGHLELLASLPLRPRRG